MRLPWLIAGLLLAGCATTPPPAPVSPAGYVLPDTAVHLVPDPASGRTYPLYVSLPENYARHPERRYPLLFLTDAPYAFPLVRAIAGRIGGSLEDFIVIGLGYSEGETRQYSRRRDYTPSPHGDVDAVSDMPGRPVRYGEAETYRRYIETQVFPFVARHYRADMQRRTFAGHSYGGLFGTHILLSRPEMFDRYILMSPSLWYGRKLMFARERAFAMRHRALPADVLFLIGGSETVPEPDDEPRGDSAYDMVGDMERFAEQLRERHYQGLSVSTHILPDEDHLTVYPAAITRGLQWAFGR